LLDARVDRTSMHIKLHGDHVIQVTVSASDIARAMLKHADSGLRRSDRIVFFFGRRRTLTGYPAFYMLYNGKPQEPARVSGHVLVELANAAEQLAGH